MTSDSGMGSGKPYYKTALVKHVVFFMFLPLLLGTIYLHWVFLKSNQRQAQNSVEWHAKTVARSMENELKTLQFSLSRLSRKRAIAEVPFDILLSQNALAQIQQFVEQHTFIDGALIQDDSGYLIESFPVHYFHTETGYLLKSTRNLMRKDLANTMPQFILLDSTELGLSEYSHSLNNQELFIGAPLAMETNSIIDPYRATGAIYLIVNLEKLMAHQAQNSTSAPANYQITYFEEILTGEQFAITDSVYLGSADIQLPVSEIRKNAYLKLNIQHDSRYYLGPFFKLIALELGVLIIALPILLWALNQFTQKLNNPLHAVIEMCRRFAKEDYSEQQNNFQYREFEELQSHLNMMANTIQNQVSSLKTAKEKAEQSERIKAQFLANMSHEIRTPMNGVLGMLQLMQSDSLSAKQKERVNKALRSAQNLLTIINDILDISKIEADKIEIEEAEFDLRETIDVVMENLRVMAKSKSLELHLKIDDSLPDIWIGDSTRISQILYNLTSNALKFTDLGGVSIKVNSPEANRLQFKVIDSGIGIPQEKLATLFDAFQQADTSTTRKYGGTGLGLTITKKLAELMGGTIQVESELDTGSTFIVTITAQPANGKTIVKSTVQKLADVPSFTGLTFVAAEDNEINQEILKAILEPTGVNLVLAENGAIAIQRTTELTPDLILMDVHMPEMDGVEATKVLREKQFHMPIIMQTANVMKDDVEHYFAIGADGCIAKPFDKIQLFETIEHALKNANKASA